MNDKRRQTGNAMASHGKRSTDRQAPVRMDGPPEGENIITPRIVEILAEKDNSPIDDIKKLMDADLAYHRQRLYILREHAANHPDAIEERKNLRFRRSQYRFLMALLAAIVCALPFVPIYAAAPLGLLSIALSIGILLNGRERDPDAGILGGVLKYLVKKQ